MLKPGLAALGCLLLAASAHAAPVPFASDPGTYRGRTIVRSADEHRIAISVRGVDEADGKKQKTEHIFRFWSEEALPTIDATYANARVEYYGNELLVIAPEEQTALRFTVGRTRVQGHPIPDEFSSTGYTGYGLNHEMGILVQAKLGTDASANLNCEPNCGEPVFEWPSETGNDCSSGGAGATSCSVTSGGSSCSINCDIGFYACCKTGWSGASCSCVRK